MAAAASPSRPAFTECRFLIRMIVFMTLPFR